MLRSGANTRGLGRSLKLPIIMPFYGAREATLWVKLPAAILMAWVSLGPTWQKEGTDSCKLPSELHTCTMTFDPSTS